jgi:hypothetical protein
MGLTLLVLHNLTQDSISVGDIRLLKMGKNIATCTQLPEKGGFRVSCKKLSGGRKGDMCVLESMQLNLCPLKLEHYSNGELKTGRYPYIKKSFFHPSSKKHLLVWFVGRIGMCGKSFSLKLLIKSEIEMGYVRGLFSLVFITFIYLQIWTSPTLQLLLAYLAVYSSPSPDFLYPFILTISFYLALHLNTPPTFLHHYYSSLPLRNQKGTVVLQLN